MVDKAAVVKRIAVREEGRRAGFVAASNISGVVLYMYADPGCVEGAAPERVSAAGEEGTEHTRT